MGWTRRRLLQAAALGAASLHLPAAWADPTSEDMLHLPAEGGPHAATWMAFGARSATWGDGGAFEASIPVARHDLARIAVTLSRFEPVHLLVATAADEREAQRLLAQVRTEQHPKDRTATRPTAAHRRAGGMRVSEALPPPRPERIQLHRVAVDDLWTRDTAPVFVRAADGGLRAVDLNFNGWGQERVRTGLRGWKRDRRKARNGIAKQPVSGDMRLARWIAGHLELPRVTTWLTMEGGGIEVNGHGLAVATESCILNPNRNPGRTKAQVEAEWRRLFGVQHVLWMPGEAAQDITDGHIDFHARFTRPDEVVLAWDGGEDEDGEPTLDADLLDALEGAQADLHARPEAERRARMDGRTQLRIRRLGAPDPAQVVPAIRARSPALRRRGVVQEETFAAGYVGWYEANGCVLASHFGDAQADDAAFAFLEARFPDRIVVQMSTDGIANGGGSIHCATQQQPRA